MTFAIEIRDLVKVFPPNIIAVDRLSLAIDEGEIFAFLGPNGAGKTTTVRLLTTLLTPTSGYANIIGYNIGDPKQATDLRKKIGILTDRPNLYLRLSARRNLLFFAKMYGLTHEESSRRIAELGSQFNLDERLDSPAGSYSKGMKQKLGILRAMIHSPSVLFLDEPTAGLDPIAQGNVREMIERISEMDTTVFMTTHNLPEAERLADKIGVINKGQLMTVGSTSDLRSQVDTSNRLIIKTLDKAVSFTHIIEKIDGVLAVHNIENEYSLEVEVADHVKTTPVLVKNLVQEGIPILEVKIQQQSLEDIYRQIMNYSANGEHSNAA